MRPVKIFKRTLACLFALILLLVAAGVLFITLYPAEKFLGMIIQQSEAALGRKVDIRGIRWGLGGISLSGVAVHDGTTSDTPILAGVEKADLRFSLLSILTMKVNVRTVKLTKATVNITFDAKGKSNLGGLVSSLSSRGPSGISASISRVVLDDAKITLSNPPPSLAPLAGTYLVDAIIDLGNDIAIRECSAILPDTRGRLHPDLIIHTSKKDFMITGSVRLENASLLWVYRWGTNVTLPYNVLNGTVSNLVITKSYVKGDADATSTLLNTNRLLHAVGSTHVDIAGRTVLIRNAQGRVDSSAFFVENLHFTFDGNLIAFSVNKVDAAVADVAPLLKFIPPKLFGRIGGALSYAGGRYNGTVSLKDCGYDQGTGIVSGVSTEISVADNIFKKTDIPFLFYGNACRLSIASTEPSLSKLFINIGSDNVSIDTKKHSYAQSDAPIRVPIEIAGIINAANLAYDSFRLSNVQLQYRLSGSEVSLRGFQFFYSGGKVGGSGTVSVGQGPPRASLAMHIGGLVVQDALSLSEKMRNRFFGLLDGDAKIDFEISRNIFKTARGNVEFSVHKGKLVDTGIQKGLGLLLAEMKYKLRDMEFNRIYGNIDIAGTDYRVNSFIFNAQDVRLKITGQFDQKLVADPLHINLEFTKKFIQDLPGAITLGINRFLKGDWYIIPFIQTGDMTDSKNVRRAD